MHRYVSGAYGYIDLSPFRVPRDYSVSALNWFSLNFLTLFCVCYIQVRYFLSAVLLRVLVFLFGAERVLAIESQSWPVALGSGFFRSGLLFSYVVQSMCRFTMWGVRNIDLRILLTVSHLRHPHLFPFRVTSYLRMWILWKALGFVGVLHEGGIMFFLTRA